ncbi:SIMPL domain-containing protein [Ruminococcus sp. JL13D9]|uniref:SIMPL domain-containing protein n=1 Tax=Ruminococcus sp. JL13D9 TaxID=3233381 RepID=UPI00389AC305
MGTMKIIGKAERKFKCDRMTIDIRVIADEPTHDRAVHKCMNDSEALLNDLQSSGIELSQIMLNNHSVSTRHYDAKPYIEAERAIRIEASYDMKLINHITDLIEENHYNADIDTEFSVSNLADIHQQLIEEAFKDSRKKADAIASLTGQKVSGIDKVIVGDEYDDDYLVECELKETRFICREKASRASDNLSATDIEESETVTVIWALE